MQAGGPPLLAASKRMNHPFTAGGPLSTTCGWRDPATSEECLQAPLSRTHRLAPEAVTEPGLSEAWAAAEAAVPEGWRPITVGPPDPDAYDKAGNAITEPWFAATVSPAFFNGETERDTEWECGYGPTPVAALLDLAARLAAVQDDRNG